MSLSNYSICFPGIPGNDFAIDNISLAACSPEIEIQGSFTEPICPGETVEFEIGFPGGFQDYWFQWQISTDGGQNWINLGEPTNETGFVAEDVPPNAILRLVMSATEDRLSNENCISYSEIIELVYQEPLECSNVITTLDSACTGDLGLNIFPDGDFGSGPDNILPFDPGFAPGYIYEFNPPPNDGTYTITNNTTPWGSFADGWIDIGDNSAGPEGYMMVVNASETPGLFFVDTIEVCEFTTYEFSADIISMNQPQFAGSVVPPNISFLIDGVAFFDTDNVPVDSSWHSYGFTFTTAAGVTQLVLALRNNTPGGLGFIGNDLAIDNISLRPCGPELILSESGAGPYCPGDSVSFELSIVPGFGDDLIQWQYSTDDGLSWQNSGGVTMSTIHILPFILPNTQVRALVAATEEALASDNCHLASNILQPQLLDINSCFEIPVQVEGALCGGQYGENIFPEGDFGTGLDVFGPQLPPGTTNMTFQDTIWPNDGFYSLMNFWDEDICMGFFPAPCWILPITDNSDGPGGLWYGGQCYPRRNRYLLHGYY